MLFIVRIESIQSAVLHKLRPLWRFSVGVRAGVSAGVSAGV